MYVHHRHQVFMIARVIANEGDLVAKYRCIGAMSHDSCFGRQPLSVAYRFMELVKDQREAEWIREEIDRYAEYSKLYTRRRGENACYYLRKAFKLEIVGDDGYPFSYCRDIGSQGAENEEGITVIDITDLKNISICFVNFDCLEAAVCADTPKNVPLTPEQYLRAYHPLKTQENREGMDPSDLALEEVTNLDILDKLKDTPIISLATLAELWPREYRAPWDRSTLPLIRRDVRSLVDLSIDQAMTYAIEGNQIDLLIEHVFRLEGKAELLFNRIKSLEAVPSSAIPFLLRYYKAFPPYPNEAYFVGLALTGSQVVELLDNWWWEDIHTLAISKNQMFDKAGLCEVLRTAPKLRYFGIPDTAVTSQEFEDLREEHPKWFHNIKNTVYSESKSNRTECKWVPGCHVLFPISIYQMRRPNV